MDLDRLTTGEKVAGGAAIALFISMWFAWFGFDNPGEALGIGGSITINAWESFDFIDLILFVTALVTVGSVVAKASDALIDFPFNPVVTILGGLCVLLVLYRIIDPPGGLDREWGVFLGLIFAVLVTYGGYRAMEEEGSSFAEIGDRLSTK
ncbi:MAG TPA: hypothetical protein VFX35_03895 [Solirubrobacterales bacterium]|nr:hypothetical protein [Solirubrobacterales bacterium]